MDSTPSDRSVFMVIFGAGASYDSVPSDEQRADPTWRPPLAAELFGNRPNFRAILGGEGIREAVSIAVQMRRLGSSESVEARLERLVVESERYERLKTQLVATQLYLQQVLWDCGQHWIQGSNYVTNYAELASRLDVWAHYEANDLVYVTFNYDTLLEAALPTRPATVPQYTEGRTRVFKVHGSVDWGRRASAGSRFGSHSDIRPVIVREGAKWELTEDYQLTRSYNGTDPSGNPLLPVVAIPTMTKSSFVMPPYHLEQLRRDLKKVRGMLVIGWRANEQHFLRELAELPNHIPVDIVSPKDPTQTASKLAEIGVRIRTRPLKLSFTNYMNAPEHLVALLRQAMDPDRSAAHW